MIVCVCDAAGGQPERVLVEGTDYALAQFSDTGSVSAVLATVAPGTFGCSASDWVNTIGTVVVIPRGNCSFYSKVRSRGAASPAGEGKPLAHRKALSCRGP
jgi:hypothetical protein